MNSLKGFSASVARLHLAGLGLCGARDQHSRLSKAYRTESALLTITIQERQNILYLSSTSRIRSTVFQYSSFPSTAVPLVLLA